MKSFRVGCVVATLASLLAAGATMHAQEHSGCSLSKGLYTCDWPVFMGRLRRAHSVRIETQPMDRFTARQLRTLVGELGKTVAAPGQPGDLTFLLIPMPSTGVHFGPAGERLATLRIYAPLPGDARGELLWAEVYTGDPDRPWPSTVHALIEQFRDRLQRH